MKLCYICSRYADPDVANRRRNLAEARALARWAEAQGYAVVTWWGDIDPFDPPVDSDPEFRRQVLARSAALAEMVARIGGDIIVPTWYPMTAGMDADGTAWRDYGNPNCDEINATFDEVEPYYTAPSDAIPRAKVQAAVDEVYEGIERAENNICNGADANIGAMAIKAYQDALDELRINTGVTPTGVQ